MPAYWREQEPTCLCRQREAEVILGLSAKLTLSLTQLHELAQERLRFLYQLSKAIPREAKLSGSMVESLSRLCG